MPWLTTIGTSCVVFSRTVSGRPSGMSMPRIACLDRYARALDKVVWDHLSGLFPAVDPWSPS